MNEENLIELKEKMEELESFKEVVALKRAEFNKQIEGLLCSQEEIEKEIISIKEKISKEALVEFNTTGNKKLTGGIGVRETNKISYPADKAFGWAKEHGLCLSLDQKAFEKIADSQDIDFVIKTKEPTVTFPKVIKLED
jgi:hypothetical protein